MLTKHCEGTVKADEDSAQGHRSRAASASPGNDKPFLPLIAPS